MEMRRKLRRPRLFSTAAAVMLGAAVVGAGGDGLPSSVAFPPDARPQIDNRAITEAGCCSGFSWSDGGDGVTFFDRDLDGRQGLWALDPANLEKTFEAPAPRLTSPSGRYLIEKTGRPNYGRRRRTSYPRRDRYHRDAGRSGGAGERVARPDTHRQHGTQTPGYGSAKARHGALPLARHQRPVPPAV